MWFVVSVIFKYFSLKGTNTVRVANLADLGILLKNVLGIFRPI
jgi:hypothetical protein